MYIAGTRRIILRKYGIICVLGFSYFMLHVYNNNNNNNNKYETAV